MDAQDGGQSDGTAGRQPPAATQAIASLGLLDDTSASAIHDALLMGWSLQELKSRVLLKAFLLNQSAPGNDATQGTSSASNSSVTTSSLLPFNLIDMLTLPQLQGMPVKQNKSISSMSEWRAIFNRIANVHGKSFPTSTTENTPYDPSPTSPLQSRFPYLYPSTTPDYSLIGINNFGSFGLADFDNDQKLSNFRLYDTTRRALNCLTLLHTKPDESLIPDIMGNYQTQVVQSINNESIATAQDDLQEASSGLSKDALNQAITVLSSLTVRFMESWDGYLRENFYAGGRLKDSEFELIAYEAGSALASLSWGISMMTIPLENALEKDSTSGQQLAQLSTTWMNIFKSQSINTVQRLVSSLGQALDDAYYRIHPTVQRPAAGEKLNPEIPSYALNAVAHSLDYWRRAVEWICQPLPESPTTSTTKTEAAIETVATSAALSTPQANTLVTKTTLAAIETTTTSTTLSIPPSIEEVKPPMLTVELSQHLRQALINQAGIWQSLLLCEQNLRSFRTESVARSILNSIMKEFEQNARSAIINPAEKQLKRYWTPLVFVAVALLVILGGGVVLLLVTNQLQSLTAVITFLVGSVLTLLSTFVTRVNPGVSPTSREQVPAAARTAQGNNNLDEQHLSIFSLAGEAITRTFQNAYKEIEDEFEYLNHHIAITYPLIEFFIMHSPKMKEEIKSSYIFLTKIIWTREEQREEIERVARVALGPFSSWVNTQSLFSGAENGASPPISSHPVGDLINKQA